MVNSRKSERRKLRFETLQAAVSEAESLAAAQRSGSLRATGNWELGQAIGHLAYWADLPFDGYPRMRPVPWVIRTAAKLFKKRLLGGGIPAGGRLPGVPAGTFGVDPMPTDEALARLRSAFGRLDQQSPKVLNPIFGEMTHDEWKDLNKRHAELHLGFFHPS